MHEIIISGKKKRLVRTCQDRWALFFPPSTPSCRLWLADGVFYPAASLSFRSGPCVSGSGKRRRCGSCGCRPGRGRQPLLQHQERSVPRSLQPSWERAPPDGWGRNCSRGITILFLVFYFYFYFFWGSNFISCRKFSSWFSQLQLLQLIDASCLTVLSFSR